ncbi:alcohol dehydrogenase catalytic domain-containing protein [Amycolatopsis sp. K13G38]|uniref:alcohol dehydrogenase n=1 Tax=Amycolatopsis acididurans TaxID=2724524 RepID=A0ABX1J8M9_9PSEU|nr:alcohol dehydrogenase catalytic domain-containing protein [Amycolatopsis acididurans]NKQ54700.1 alcohol dehydrogenase catalytic domain-containing protein [Amycolatopsis acididurans]
MRAFRLVGAGDARLGDVPEPSPGPGQVRLAVSAAGVCHSDLHVIHEGVGAAWAMPFTLGHEICGTVAEAGDGVSGLEPGTQVVVHAPLGCGECARCRAGVTNYCDRRRELPAAGIGLGVDGGMAESIVVDAGAVVPAPGIDPCLAATLTDAGLTSYHALTSARGLEKGALIVVIGVGGLGHLALQMAQELFDARVVAVDTRPEALGLAETLGADAVVRDGREAAAAVHRLSGGWGADAVLDFAGVPATTAFGTGLLRTAGELVLVGSGGGSFEVTKAGTLPQGLRISVPFWGSRTELEEVVALAARGALRTEATAAPLDEAAEAMERLHRGEIVGRCVLVP